VCVEVKLENGGWVSEGLNEGTVSEGNEKVLRRFLWLGFGGRGNYDKAKLPSVT
jgi:hypothetical protein